VSLFLVDLGPESIYRSGREDTDDSDDYVQGPQETKHWFHEFQGVHIRKKM